jgi:hypothetical protein
MPAHKLKQHLIKGSMVSDTLRDTITHCAEPSLATFVLRSIFRNLQSRGWDDQQGASTAEYDPFKNGVMPQLLQIADILSATPPPNLSPNWTTWSSPIVIPSRQLHKKT